MPGRVLGDAEKQVPPFDRNDKTFTVPLVGGFTGGFEVGVGSGSQSDRDDFADVGTIRIVPGVHSSIGVERAGDAAMVVDHKVGIVPLSAKLDGWAVSACEVCEDRRVIHI